MNALLGLVGLVLAILFFPVIYVVVGATALHFWETYQNIIIPVGAGIFFIVSLIWARGEDKKTAARKAAKLEEAKASE